MGFKTTIPAPSLRTNPFARESKALQRPSGDSIPIRLKPIYQSGVSKALTPPAKAIFALSIQMLWQARCTATRAEEHAVSTAELGPRKSKQYEIRLAAML